MVPRTLNPLSLVQLGVVVDGVAIGVAGLEAQSVTEPLVNADLECVIAGISGRALGFPRIHKCRRGIQNDPDS